MMLSTRLDELWLVFQQKFKDDGFLIPTITSPLTKSIRFNAVSVSRKIDVQQSRQAPMSSGWRVGCCACGRRAYPDGWGSFF